MSVQLNEAGISPAVITKFLSDHFGITVNAPTLQVWKSRARTQGLPPDLFGQALARFLAGRVAQAPDVEAQVWELARHKDMLDFHRRFPHLNAQDTTFLQNHLTTLAKQNADSSIVQLVLSLAETWDKAAAEFRKKNLMEPPAFSKGAVLVRDVVERLLTLLIANFGLEVLEVVEETLRQLKPEASQKGGE